MTITENTTVETEAPGLPAAIAANARELDDLRGAMKVLKEREDTLRAAVLDFLKGNGLDSATDGAVTVSLAAFNRKNIDRARMEALYPKVLEDVTTIAKVEQIRVKIR